MTTAFACPLVPEGAPKSFYGSNPRPHLPDPDTPYAVKMPEHIPDDEEINFEFIFPAGTLRPRMSALELGLFIVEHMQAILSNNLLNYPRVKAEFQAILTLFLTMPQAAVDRVLPWVQSVDRAKEKRPDDVIVLSLFAKHAPERTQKIFY